MAIIIGIDSSSITSSCAVLRDGELLAEGFVNNGLTHSQTLLPMINDTLKKANIGCSEIDLICITKGPGSFTGLRIGMSTAKGLAAPYNIPCVGVSTLEAAAYGVYLSAIYANDTLICAVMDARCGQVYNGIYVPSESGICAACSDRALAIDDLKTELRGYNKHIVLCGDGAKLCYDRLADEIDCEVCGNDIMYVHGHAVALLGEKYSDGAVDFADLRPFYLRLPQAQRELKLKKDKK
ncbi:MAG: tRNA (adenosine(37)-N6)-threonylcarbamoyltransferase complex dimerization subunit type 1 TsaB [Acutalibacteraceae bacterium]